MKNRQDRSPQRMGPISTVGPLEELQKVMDYCPSCFETLKPGALDCFSCGIVLANFHRVSTEKRLKLTIGGLYHLTTAECMELETAWNKVESVYFDNRLHNQFMHLCLRLKSLPYAIKKYSDRLSLDPQDEVAQIMRQRVMVLATESIPGSAMAIPGSDGSFMAEALLRVFMVMLVIGVCVGSVILLTSVLTPQRYFFLAFGLFLTFGCLSCYLLLKNYPKI